MKLHHLIPLFLCALFVGCSGPSRQQMVDGGALLNKSSRQVAAETVMVDDVQSDSHIFSSPFFPNQGAVLYLKSTVSRQFSEDYLLCLAMTLEEEVSFDKVEVKTMGSARQLQVLSDSRSQDGRLLYGVVFSRKQLEAVTFPGIQLKLFGEKHSAEFLFPDNYVKGFLNAVDSGVKDLKKAAKAAAKE